MKYQDKLKKAISNIEHLDYELLGFGVGGLLMVNDHKGNQMIPLPTLDFFANFAWCPYCNEALGDDPFCSKCGEVTGDFDKKFYEYGKIREHYEFKMTNRDNYKDFLLYTRIELNKYTLDMKLNWDGTLKHLKNIYNLQMNLNVDIEEIDEWEV